MAITKNEEKRIAARIYARVGVVVAVVMALLGGVLWGVGVFAKTEVQQELSAQNIYFPQKGSSALDPKEFPDLQQYAGQKLDDGYKARAYANGFIGRHLEKVAGGKTYAEVSALASKDPTNQKLQQQKQTLFQGETLRGMLLGNGYGFWLMGDMAQYAALACFATALGLVVLAMWLSLRAKSLK